MLLLSYIQCESCFDDLESYYRCTGDNDSAIELREADCARSDNDGKYCAQSIFDGIANGDLPVCGEEDDICDATCAKISALNVTMGDAVQVLMESLDYFLTLHKNSRIVVLH